MTKPDLLRRREALAALGALGLAAALPKLRGLTATDSAEAASCVLMPELTEGPYWIANHLTRRDITEHRPGVPLALRFVVQDARGTDIYAWNAVVDQTVIRPGEKVTFRSRLASPPPEAHSVVVRFFHRRDLAAGSV